jgi:glycosyltransferase involved in cell wall biosynthesis
MNVLHVTLSFDHGGRREAIAELCRGLIALGVTNRLCCLDNFDSTEAERAACFADSIELKRRRLWDWPALRRLRAYCAANAIDVVHAHDAASQAACVLALPRARPPILMTFHRTRNFESARPRDRLRNALANLRVAAVVTASEERRRHYLENNHVRTAKVQCIPLGINLQRFRPDADRRASKRRQLGVDDETLLIGTVGHFAPEKGVDVAISAFQIFRARHPEIKARLIVLGTGSEQRERYLRARAAERFAESIEFAGFQLAPEQWFPAFDLLLHGARSEAFGLVLAEAMACGVPIVAARVGGIPEVVEDGSSGMLASAPAADKLADALVRALCSPGWLEEAAAHARARAHTQFGSERYAHRYFELYNQLLARRVAA